MPTIRKSSKNTRKSTARRTTSRTSAKSSSKRRSTKTPAGYPVSKFTTVRDGIQSRVGSFRNIFSQVSGKGKVTAFSPRTAQQWFNLVQKGACVYKFSAPQVAKVVGSTKYNANPSNTAITKAFQSKFGKAAIKGVTKGRGNTWLVATNSQINKGPFKNYTWK